MYLKDLLTQVGSRKRRELRNRDLKKTRKLVLEELESRRVFAAFQAGSIAVYRVGDGTQTLAATGNSVFIDEFSTSGTLIQSIALPTTVNGNQLRLIAAGTSTSEGQMTRSADGSYLVLAGYDAPIPTTATVNRVIGRIDGLGNIDTSTGLTDAASGNNPRSVVSTNGTDLWIGGGSGGLRYTTFGSTTSTQINVAPGTNPLTNVRAAEIYNGQLYLGTQSGSNWRCWDRHADDGRPEYNALAWSADQHRQPISILHGGLNQYGCGC
jgi:hypothetical protein